MKDTMKKILHVLKIIGRIAIIEYFVVTIQAFYAIAHQMYLSNTAYHPWQRDPNSIFARGDENIEMTIFFLPNLGIILFLIIYYGIGGKTRCPECKKRFAMKKISKVVDHVEDGFSVKVVNKNRDRNGDVISTSEQHVPGERIVYRLTYRCKNCGKEYYKYKELVQPKL